MALHLTLTGRSHDVLVYTDAVVVRASGAPSTPESGPVERRIDIRLVSAVRVRRGWFAPPTLLFAAGDGEVVRVVLDRRMSADEEGEVRALVHGLRSQAADGRPLHPPTPPDADRSAPPARTSGAVADRPV
jgi:hypothetical protein